MSDNNCSFISVRFFLRDFLGDKEKSMRVKMHRIVSLTSRCDVT